MKAIKTTIILLFFLTNGLSQNCEVNPILADYYEKDVKHLAILRMEMFDALELSNPEISQVWQDTIWEGLAAIFNADFLARDEVFDQYCIHHDSWSTGDFLRITEKMVVLIDSSASWQQNWIDGIITTDHPIIDSLLFKYGFEEVRPWISSSTTKFTLTTNRFLNVRPIADSLETVAEVLIAEPKSNFGGSRQIRYQNNNGIRTYDFIIGYGDCFNGCIFNYGWRFQVDESCNASFAGNWGSNDGNEFPPPLNCDISQITSNRNEMDNTQIQIYPNPSENQITIFKNDGQDEILEYKMIDFLGNEIQKGTIINGQNLNINHLPIGCYIILIQDQKGKSYLEKIIKR